jgi:acyl-CoA ligase (AMP-forming) (exosortase A-associated)
MRTQIHDLIKETARLHADKAALTCKDVTVSYAELWRRVASFGAALKSLPICRGDRVAIYLDKRIETVSALFGTSAGEGVFVPINPLLRPKQVGYVVEDCSARVLVTSAERLALLHGELQECKSVEHVVLVGQDAPAEPGCHYSVSPWPAAAECDIASAHVIDADMAAILYTSGSTGMPKGVVLSHRNLIAGAESVSHYLGHTADDVILSALPFSFDAGFSQLTTAFCAGAHAVLLNYIVPRDVVRLCARHRVTGLTGVPPLWIQLAAQDWPAEAAQHLRYFANTGGRMPKATLDRLRWLFPAATPFLMYGLTEAFRSTFLDPAEIDRRPGSIGKAIPNAEILVVRPDGSLCHSGEEGQLVHRGALVAMGYWNDPERTAQRFRPVPARAPGVCTDEIAVWSGDTVVRDDEGFLYFIGRDDEMIKTSGYRVSPTEIEEAAYDTGLVRDAVALGLADERLGQRIVLVVSPASGTTLDADALLARMRQAVPLYMLPHRVAVKKAISRSPNGKFDRAMLREELTG